MRAVIAARSSTGSLVVARVIAARDCVRHARVQYRDLAPPGADIRQVTHAVVAARESLSVMPARRTRETMYPACTRVQYLVSRRPGQGVRSLRVKMVSHIQRISCQPEENNMVLNTVANPTPGFLNGEMRTKTGSLAAPPPPPAART